MKHIMREYLPMELEKDERVYGGHDAAVRAEMTSKTEPRWSILKPYIVTTAYAEVAAGRCMSMLIDAVPNNELRNGYHVQFVDEVRHTGMQMALARWARQRAGPRRLAPGRRRCRAAATRQALNALHFVVGDPVQCAFTLQVVAETAFTNLAFVALPDVAARNGDFTLPTTYLSVQSGEARHISNGYATLLTVLQDDANVPLIGATCCRHGGSTTRTWTASARRSWSARPGSVGPGDLGKWDQVGARRLVPLLRPEAGPPRPRAAADMFERERLLAGPCTRTSSAAGPSGCCASGVPRRSTRTTSSGSSRSTPAGTRSTASSTRPSAR